MTKKGKSTQRTTTMWHLNAAALKNVQADLHTYLCQRRPRLHPGMRAVSAAGEKPKVTLGQRLCTKFGVKLCFWGESGKNRKGAKTPPRRQSLVLTSHYSSRGSGKRHSKCEEKILKNLTRWKVRGLRTQRVEWSDRFSSLAAGAQLHASIIASSTVAPCWLGEEHRQKMCSENVIARDWRYLILNTRL